MPSKLKEKLKFFESLSSSSQPNSRNSRSSIIPDEARQNNNNNNSIEQTSPRNPNSARNSIRLQNDSQDSKIPRKSGRFRLVGEDIVYEEEPQIQPLNSSSSEDSSTNLSSPQSRKKKDSMYRVVKLDKDTNEIKERELDTAKQASRRNSISFQSNGNKSNSFRARSESKIEPPHPIEHKEMIEDFATITEQLDALSDSQGEVPLVNNRKKPSENESIPQSKVLSEIVVDATANANTIPAPKTPRRLPPITRTPRSPVPPLTIPSFTKTPLSSPAISERSSSFDSPPTSKSTLPLTLTKEVVDVMSSSLDPAVRKQIEDEDSVEAAEGANLLKQLESYLSLVAQKKSKLIQREFESMESKSKLEKQLSDMNIENQALAEQIEWLRLQIEEMNKTRDYQDSLITTMQQELHQTSKLNDELSRKMDQQDQTIRTLETQLKKYKSYASGVQEYEQIISKLNKNISTLTSELQYAQQENVSQQTVLQALQADNKHLSQQIIQIEESLLCVICAEKVADCVASPCHHQAVCDACCRAKNLSQCVLCRAAVHKYLKVYVNWTPKNLK